MKKKLTFIKDHQDYKAGEHKEVMYEAYQRLISAGYAKPYEEPKKKSKKEDN